MSNSTIVTDRDGTKYYMYQASYFKKPKTWQEVGVRRFKEFKETNYNTWLFRLYRTRSNELRYGVYLDGCINEQFGVLSEIKE